MIKIGERTFVPLKVAAARVGYSVEWVRRCASAYGFPRPVYLTTRRSGFWLDELDRWIKKRAKRRAA